MNAAYPLFILDDNFSIPDDWLIWQGTSEEVSNQSFFFQRQQDNKDAYYLILETVPGDQAVTSNYSVKFNVSSMPEVKVDVGNKSYKVRNYETPLLADSAEITSATGAPLDRNEFENNIPEFNSLISTTQTLSSVVNFDESSLMRFYEEYVDVIDGVNGANNAIFAIDFFASSYAARISGAGGAEYVAGAMTNMSKKLVNLAFEARANYLGSEFIAASFSALREYKVKKAQFLEQLVEASISLDGSISIDQPLIDESMLLELYVLQTRATRLANYGMEVYRSTADVSNYEEGWAGYMQFMGERISQFH